MPLAGATDYPTPTLRNQLGLRPLPYQPIAEPTVHAGHGEPRVRLLCRKQRTQLRQHDIVLIDQFACPFTYHGVKMPLDGEQCIFRNLPQEMSPESLAV